LISIKVHQTLKKNRMEFYSIKVGQTFWSKISLTVVTIKVSSKTLSKFSLTKTTLIVTTGLKKEYRKKQQNIKDRNNEENMIKMHVHCLRSYCDCEMYTSNKSTITLVQFVSKCNVGCPMVTHAHLHLYHFLQNDW
jgi:plasmid maintenance system killer protein